MIRFPAYHYSFGGDAVELINELYATGMYSESAEIQDVKFSNIFLTIQPDTLLFQEPDQWTLASISS